MEDKTRQMNQEFQELLEERRRAEEQTVKRLKEEGKWIRGLDANCSNPVLKQIEKEFWEKVDQLKNKYREQYHPPK